MKKHIEKCCEVVDLYEKRLGLTDQQFERHTNIPAGSIGRWRRGEREQLTAMTITKLLLTFPEVSAEWMMKDDEGLDMFVSGNAAPSAPAKNIDADYEKHLIDEIAYLREKLDTANQTIAKMAVMIAESRTVG